MRHEAVAGRAAAAVGLHVGLNVCEKGGPWWRVRECGGEGAQCSTESEGGECAIGRESPPVILSATSSVGGPHTGAVVGTGSRAHGVDASACVCEIKPPRYAGQSEYSTSNWFEWVAEVP